MPRVGRSGNSRSQIREAVPDEFWCIDEQKLGQVVRTDKDKAVIPGVRVYSEDATSW